MSDAMSSGGGAAGSLGLGLANYISAIQSNQNARQQNATNDKWGPLLALNSSKGAANVQVPKASFASIMGPAAVSAMNASNTGDSSTPDMTDSSGGSSGLMAGMMAGMGGGMATGGVVAPHPMKINAGMAPRIPTKSPFKFAGGGLTAAERNRIPGQDFALPGRRYPIENASHARNALARISQHGSPSEKSEVRSKVHSKFPGIKMMAGGGDTGSDPTAGISSILSMLPMLAMLAADGGQVPGQANVPGDSLQNDTQLIAASPGEGVVPRSVMKKPTPWKVAAYLNEVKKHGPGPLPVKSQNSKPPGKGSSSMSPWSAMCHGGMTREK